MDILRNISNSDRCKEISKVIMTDTNKQTMNFFDRLNNFFTKFANIAKVYII